MTQFYETNGNGINKTNKENEDNENKKTENEEDAYEFIEKYYLEFPFSSASIYQDRSPSDNHGNAYLNRLSPYFEYFYKIDEPVLVSEKRKLFEKVLRFLNDSADFEIFEQTFEASADPLGNREKRINFLEKKIEQILKTYSIHLSDIDFQLLMYFVKRDFFGFGQIQPFLEDLNIEDISCNGSNIPIYIFHRKYGSVKTNISLSESEADKLIRRMAQFSKKHISVSNPMTDATLPNGSRAHLTLGNEITTKGSTFTIRKFNENPFLPSDLVNNDTFSPEMMAYLWLCIESNMNLMFAGGTASGKTTSLNAVCRFIPPNKKIVSIEDTREINLPHRNWISGLSREPAGNFSENSAGRVSLYDLLKAALRQRPEYILVGEIRGSEAYVLFQAMATGHTTVSTMHAESADALIHRLENPPMNVPRIMIQTLDVLVLLAQIENEEGCLVKKCLSIHEILETDPHTSEVLTQEIFNYSETQTEKRGQMISDAFAAENIQNKFETKNIQNIFGTENIFKSFVLEKIRIRKGWTKEKLADEFIQRVLSFKKTNDSIRYSGDSK